jgi:hypothetical protein
MLNYLSTIIWKHMGEWRYSSTILDLGTRGRVSCQPHTPAVWAQEPVWSLWRGEKSCICRESKPGLPAHFVVAGA